MDAVYDVGVNNETISRDLLDPAVQKAVEGFNGTFFVYGATNSGKTHTMLGGEREEGLIQLAADELQRIKDEGQHELHVESVFFQCYMGEVHDLHDHSTLVDKKGEPIKQDMCKKVPGGITAVHAALSRRVIETGDDVRDSMRHGNKRRNILNNDVNHNSSRSHVVYQLLDLAGAEPNTDKNAESKNINLSLTFISRYFKGLPNVDPKALPSRNARDDSTKLIELILPHSNQTPSMQTDTPIRI